MSEDSFLEKNLISIAQKSSIVANEIRAHSFQDIQFAYSDSNDVIMLYKEIPLHSLINPIEEAASICNCVKNKEYNNLIIIFGLGLGYLFKKASMDFKGTIIVYEPHLDVLRATLEAVDFSEEMARENVWLVTNLKQLKYIFSLKYFEGDTATIQILPAYKQFFPDLFNDLKEAFQEMYIKALSNKNTVVSRAKNWGIASLKNIFYVLQHPNVQILANNFKGIPVVAVSAGPSLNYAIDKLKEIKDKVFIIAIGQALRTLAQNNIKPHLVVVIENENVVEQFSEVDFIKDLRIVLQPATHLNIHKLPAMQHYIQYPIADITAEIFAKEIGRDITGFYNAGTVSICAYNIAKTLGASPLIILGQDFAFQKGSRYAKGSAYDSLKYNVDNNNQVKFTYENGAYESMGKNWGLTENEFNELIKRENFNVTTIKGWNGENLYTSHAYKDFLQIFEQLLENDTKNIEVINTSVGGAYINGVEHTTFEKAISRCNLNHNMDINKLIDEIYNKFSLKEDEILKIYTVLKNEQENVCNASIVCESSLTLVDEIINELDKNNYNNYKINSLLAKLGGNDQNLSKFISKVNYINLFIKDELYNFNKTFARAEDSESSVDEITNLKNNLNVSSNLYKAIVNGAKIIDETVSEVINENKELLKQFQ